MKSQAVTVPRRWMGRRLYFVETPAGVMLVRETISLTRRDAQRKAEAWAGMRWRDMQAIRYKVESVK